MATIYYDKNADPGLIKGKRVLLQTGNGARTWTCGPDTSNGVGLAYLPQACRG